MVGERYAAAVKGGIRIGIADPGVAIAVAEPDPVHRVVGANPSQRVGHRSARRRCRPSHGERGRDQPPRLRMLGERRPVPLAPRRAEQGRSPRDCGRCLPPWSSSPWRCTCSNPTSEAIDAARERRLPGRCRRRRPRGCAVPCPNTTERPSPQRHQSARTTRSISTRSRPSRITKRSSRAPCINPESCRAHFETSPLPLRSSGRGSFDSPRALAPTQSLTARPRVRDRRGTFVGPSCVRISGWRRERARPGFPARSWRGQSDGGARRHSHPRPRRCPSMRAQAHPVTP